MARVEYEDALCLYETDLALLVQIEGDEYWIPKSQIHDDSEVYKDGTDGTLVISSWFAERLNVESSTDTSTADQQLKPLQVTSEQRRVIDRAIQAVRLMTEDPEAPEGRCIELVCADFLAGAE